MRPAAWLALAVLAAPAWGMEVVPPDTGPDAPPAGVSLFSELFPDGPPAPFAALLTALRTEAGAENVRTALVPLGRSLQRYAAHPDYFGSPRVVVAVSGDAAAGPGAPRLADRLFLGYQPAARVIEAISYNEEAGRFEFQEVVDYGEPGAVAQPAERRVCLACHQGQGPIFARPLWSETNANPAVVERLAALGAEYHAAPVAATVDALAAFDEATDRAATVAAANRLWDEGCGDPRCRATLLAAAVRRALGADGEAEAPGFAERTARLWPAGLGVVSPDLANRDPLLAEDPTDLETEGPLDPRTPRSALAVWRAEDGFAGAAALIAAEFTPGDRAWIAGLAAAAGGPARTLALDCAMEQGRFDCAGDGVRLSGLAGAGGLQLRGVVIDGRPSVGRLAGGRLPDGRVARLSLAGAAGTLTLTDDLAALGPALAARAEAGAPALGDGPFRRRAVLGLIADCLEAGNG